MNIEAHLDQVIANLEGEISNLKDDIEEMKDDGPQALMDLASELMDAAAIAVQDGKLIEAGAITFCAQEARNKAFRLRHPS